MFGIGLPEMILILALALIVVGPDKLPDLARSLAKGLMELKKTAEGLKESFKEEGNPLDEIRPDLEEAARSLKNNLLDTPPYKRDKDIEATGVNPPDENAAKAYQELMKSTGNTPNSTEDQDVPQQEDAKNTEPNTVEIDIEIEPPKQQEEK
jgi:sec-independent protein translocase protein TatB